jgi:hypothetical protein
LPLPFLPIGNEKNRKNLAVDNHYISQDLNWELPEHKLCHHFTLFLGCLTYKDEG